MYRSLLLPYKPFVIQNFCKLCLQSYNLSCKYRQFSILNNVKKAIFASFLRNQGETVKQANNSQISYEKNPHYLDRECGFLLMVKEWGRGITRPSPS